MKLNLLKSILLTTALMLPLSAPCQQAGKFDYYLLNLSWSPEFCYSHPMEPECSRHLGLIVHGLWPQYNGRNMGPERCSQAPGPSNPASLLDIMPSTALVSHEWLTHGTCSGLNANDYFGLIRRLYSGLHAPSQLQHPNRQSIYRVTALKQAIMQANPGLNESEIALTCRSQYLSEVEICFTKDGRPQPCQGLRQCTKTSVLVPPVK